MMSMMITLGMDCHNDDVDHAFDGDDVVVVLCVAVAGGLVVRLDLLLTTSYSVVRCGLRHDAWLRNWYR